MPLKARCPSCGKSARFPDSDVGLPAVCAACGTRYTLPRFITRDDRDGASGATIDTSSSQGHRPGLGWPAWTAVGLAVAAAGLAVAVVLTIALRPDFLAGKTPATPPTPASPAPRAIKPPEPVLEKVDAKRVATLKTDAEALAVDGLYKDAHRKYREIELLVAGRRIDDPAVRTMVESARSERQEIFKRFIQPADPTAQDVPPPPPTQTTPRIEVPPPPPEPIPPPRSLSNRPPLQPVPAADEAVSDAQIGRAITKATDYLLSVFDEKTHSIRGGPLGDAQIGGTDALAVYALLQAGRATNDPRLNIKGKRMEGMIEAMKGAKLSAGHPQTYARGIRATALALFDRPQDREVLREDVFYLLKNHKQGAYTYNSLIDDTISKPVGATGGFRFKGSWDNSNSQYGLLGVWAGAESGAVTVPRTYWSFVQQHWSGSQLADGTWPYNDEPTGTLSMTVAGVASLFVTQDFLTSNTVAAAGQVGRPPFTPALRKALKWLEEGDNALQVDKGGWPAYTLYGVERAGLASGFKYFGAHDWYRTHAARLIKRQAGDGGWGDVADTSFCLLFLARGRHPILMNKLRFDASEGAPIVIANADDSGAPTDVPPTPAQPANPRAGAADDPFAGYWNNHPRDLANLARFAGRQLERDLNWQVVSLQRDFPDWLDSPILYIASHKAPHLSAADKQKLRGFVDAGGILFTHADGDSAEFNQFAESLANSLFGEKYEMTDLPQGHPLFSVVFKVGAPPRLRGVSNGSRLLMLHSPTDLARSWQGRDERNSRELFDLGTNLFLYAAGKRDLRNRLDSPYVTDPGPNAPHGTVPLARLTYSGNWDPEPGAFVRFGRWMHRETGTGVDAKPIPLSSLGSSLAATFPIAHLTGTAKTAFSAYDVKAIKAYVEAGGVLVIDPCGGSQGFRESTAGDLVAKAFPGVRAREVIPGHPLVSAGPPGMDDLAKPRVRPYATDALKQAGTGTIEVIGAGKGHVILLPLDLTSGLLGTGTWGISGYEPGFAQDLMKNVIFWMMDGQREK